jgi:DNA topoisomerase-1
MVRDKTELARIRALVIPPAYRDVWICADPNGHIQAVGRDTRGRKQYRYHVLWRQHRDAGKFDRMLEFGSALPRIRRVVNADLSKKGLPREKVLATIIKLLESTLVRIGNVEYARSNSSYGLTTLRDRHASISGGRITFEFRGKSGVMQRVSVHDPALARIVRRCQDLPGQELFQWVGDDGERYRVDSSDVNEYLRAAAGSSFTAKDFRTWFATIHALELLRSTKAGSKRHVQKTIVDTVRTVAARLGNTPSVCRKAYIHPLVLSAFAAGELAQLRAKTSLHSLKLLLGAAVSEGSYKRVSPRSNPPRRTLTAFAAGPGA